MSPTDRNKLQGALCRYTADTFTYLNTVRGFCEKISKWMLRRESELDKMRDIKKRADKIYLNITHVTESENKRQAVGEFLKSWVTRPTADMKYTELEKMLAAVLQGTLGGLEELDCFLDAVEKLAVTSLHVFKENQVLQFPKGTSFKSIQVVIAAARRIVPLLVDFKRDAGAFFLPRLQNVEVMLYQLDQYIQTTQRVCEGMKESCFSDFTTKMKTKVNTDVDLSEDDVQRMLSQINRLVKIRMDKHFRMVFLFREDSSSEFIKEFSERKPRMLQFLNDLEQCAVQLDNMNKGAKISSVAGSSMGAVGGVLSIVGLALIPVTAGVSLALTMTGLGLGITSGVNSIVTTAAEIGVNCTEKKKANEFFRSFMEDVQVLQSCLEEVTQRETSMINVALQVGKVACKAGAVGRGIDGLVNTASTAKLLKNEGMITNAGKVAAQEGRPLGSVSRGASDIPDAGQAAVKGPLAVCNAARAGLMAVNALFIGVDVFFICKNGIALAKGSKGDTSKFIRARGALWSSEMDSWQMIHDSLHKGLQTSMGKKNVLETPFYPQMKKQRKYKK